MTTGPTWVFDESEIADPMGFGDRACRFVRKLRLHEGRLAGQRFPLARWQERILRRVYGDVDEHGRRRLRTVFLMLPRGNGKTTLAASLCGLHLFGPEKDAGGQVIAAAADREQASIAFRSLRGMIDQDDTLRRITHVVPSHKRIEHRDSRSEFKAVSHEAYTKHGLSVSFLLCDEVHSWPTRDLYDVLTQSMGKRDAPLTIVITTAGVGTTGLAHDLYTYAKRVASGEVLDPTFLPILFEAPRDCDWQDESIWTAVNPAIASGFRSLDEMRVKAKQAAEVPSERESFKRYYLNIWSDGAADPWLDLAAWDRCADPVDLDAREGERAWIGVDLGSTGDLTAVVLALRDPDGGFSVVPFVFAPSDTLRRRQERGDAPYLVWAEAGHILPTEGSVTDYAVVEETIRDLCRRFQVAEIALDPWGARSLINRLLEDGLPAVEHRQGYQSMSGPTKEVERAVMSGKLRHGAHPVLRWCVGNTVVDRDPAGNVKPNKDKSRAGSANLKIDATVAMIMAVGRAAVADTATSIFDDMSDISKFVLQ